MTGLLKLVGKCLLFFGIWGAAISGAVFFLVQRSGDAWVGDLPSRYFSEAAGIAGLIAGLFLIGVLVERRGWLSLGLRLSALPAGVIGGAVFGLAISFVTILVLFLRGEAQIDVGKGVVDLPVMAAFLGFIFLNALQQELMVRSYLFQAIDQRYGAVAAVVTTTIIFVLLHAGALAPNLAGAIAALNLTLAGLLLGLAVLLTRSIWLAVGIHFGWNGFQILFLNSDFTQSGINIGDWRPIAIAGDDLWTGANGLEAGLAGLLGPALGVAVLLVVLFQRRGARLG